MINKDLFFLNFLPIVARLLVVVAVNEKARRVCEEKFDERLNFFFLSLSLSCVSSHISFHCLRQLVLINCHSLLKVELRTQKDTFHTFCFRTNFKSLFFVAFKFMAAMLQQVDGDESFEKSFSNGTRLGSGTFGVINQVVYRKTGQVVAVVKRVSLSRQGVEQLTLQEVPTLISFYSLFHLLFLTDPDDEEL